MACCPRRAAVRSVGGDRLVGPRRREAEADILEAGCSRVVVDKAGDVRVAGDTRVVDGVRNLDTGYKTID